MTEPENTLDNVIPPATVKPTTQAAGKPPATVKPTTQAAGKPPATVKPTTQPKAEVYVAKCNCIYKGTYVHEGDTLEGAIDSPYFRRVDKAVAG